MNVNLGTPYESILRRIIEKGYAGNQTEAIRQALTEFDRKISEEEVALVHKAVEFEMGRIDSGEVKTYSWEAVKKRAGIR
jgi:Arc/MetJ-type ribon-helix-helix transcriptional regulator